jgi:hypothetical protein
MYISNAYPLDSQTLFWKIGRCRCPFEKKWGGLSLVTVIRSLILLVIAYRNSHLSHSFLQNRLSFVAKN